MLEIIIKSFRNIVFNKSRSILTVFGISVGIGAVIITLMTGDIGSSALNEEIDGLGMGGLAISTKKDSAPLTDKELNSLKKLSYVRSAMPLVFDTTGAYINGVYKNIFLWGIDRNAEGAISLKLLHGRFINKGDIASKARVCMVDMKFAEEYFGSEYVAGKKIIINNGDISAPYTIVGVIKTGSGLLQNFMGNVIPDFVYIPYSTMQSNTHNKNFSQIILKTDESQYDTAENDIIKTMERETMQKELYEVNNLAKQKDSLKKILNIFSLILSAVGSISLVVAGLNIMNIMLVSVKERTREIGIKKSIGATRTRIVAEFISEAIMISLIGGIIGIAGGTGIMLLASLIMGLTFRINLIIIMLMLAFSVIIGAVFGFYPALRAASLDPVEALRYN